jgi:AsmA protein
LRLWLKILLALAGMVAIVAVSLALFVNANTFRPVIEKHLAAMLGRDVKLGDLHFSLLTGDLIAKNLSVADDPVFSTSPFLTAKEIRLDASLRPLIFSHEVNLRSLNIDSPQINIIRSQNGAWNFAGIVLSGGSARGENGGEQESSPGSPRTATAKMVNIAISRFSIENGRVVVTVPPEDGPARLFEHVNIDASNFSPTSQFPLELSADITGGGTVKFHGRVGPINRRDPTASAIDGQISIQHLDPLANGLFELEAGMSFFADAEGRVAFDGDTLNSRGTARIERLQLHKSAPALAKPLTLAYSGTLLPKNFSTQIDDLTAEIGDASIHVKGTYKPAGPNPKSVPLILSVAGQSVSIDELQPLITAAAIHFPNGAVLKGGTLSMNLAVTGRPESLVIAGPIALDNTRLVGFDVSSKIHGIAALSGVKTGDTTEFEKLHATVRITNAGVEVDKIDAVVTGMGELTGSGTVSPSNQLDFDLHVKVESVKGVGKLGVGLLTKLNGSGDNGAGVPMHITGTSDDPYITADVGGIVKKKTKSIVSIFGKKK